MKHLIGTVVLILIGSLCSLAQKKEIKVLQLNIWQEGTSVEGGYDAIVNEIVRLDPDFVTLSEVRNYKGTRFCDRITASLARKGKTYYSFYSTDSGILSRYPIKDSQTVYFDKGSIYKLVANVGRQEVCVYTAHLDYQNCSMYLPRGYDGSTWKKLPAPIVDKDSILADCFASKRDEAFKAFRDSASVDMLKGRIVFLGGDFNEASWRDWTDATKNMFDHKGLVIEWPVTAMLEQMGLKDSYRTKFPNPVTHPGFTFPADCESVPVSRLAWAPDADERDRIDFIFYSPNKKLKLLNSAVVGPKGDICRNQRVEEKTQDPFITPVGVWPTDHKGVLSTFELKK